MIQPPKLERGKKIGILATARRVTPDNLECALKVIREWGFEVVLSSFLYSTDHSYLAGTDEQRTTALQQFLNDPEISAIFCARGGYGTTRILDNVSFDEFSKHPKWIVGFSDVTALHLRLHYLGFESIHATMPILFSKPDAASSLDTLRDALVGEPADLHGTPASHDRHGSAEGILVGGNLSLVADSLGTPYEPETSGKILVLEEVDEYLYKIDRMIVQLKRAKKLSNLAGLVVGHFSEIKDTELAFGESTEQIIRFHTREYSYPVGFGFPTGHQNPNHAWISGRNARLEVSPNASMLKHLPSAQDLEMSARGYRK